MSKKMNKLVLLSALMIAIISTFGTVSAEVYNLTAGGGDEIGFKVGEVNVTNNATHLTVTYTITNESWCINETHLHIATSVDEEDGIPQTKKGNPIPGQFDNSTDHLCVDEYTYTIPLSWASGTELYIAAHAAVEVQVDDVVMDEETAWGGDEDFPGRNWAMYFTYEIVDEE